jgi:hypothetical protein
MRRYGGGEMIEDVAQEHELPSIVKALERQAGLAMALAEVILRARQIMETESEVVGELRAVLAEIATARTLAPALAKAPWQSGIESLEACLEACIRNIEPTRT